MSSSPTKAAVFGYNAGMRMNLRRRAFVVAPFALGALAFSVFIAPVQASAYSDGNTSYQAGNYAAALSSYQQAAAQDSGESKAEDLYKEGLAFHKLGQNSQAVAAYTQAQQADPSFASTHAKFQRNLQTAQQDSGGAATATATSGTVTTNTSTTSGTASPDPAAVALATGNVYVDPVVASQVDASQLQTASTANPETTVKVAVLDRLPNYALGQHAGTDLPSGRLVELYAKNLHDYLHLGQNGLVVVALHGNSPSAAGVADDSGKLNRSQESAIAQQSVSRIGSGNVTQGTVGMMHAVAEQATTAANRPKHMIELIFLIVVVAIILLLVSASRQRKVAVNTLRGPLEAQRESVLSGISYLDNYIDVLPKNNADSDQVRAFRQAAAYKLDQASKIMARQGDSNSLYEAQGLLQQANTDVSNARQYLDRATGGTGKIAGDDAVRPIPFPTNQTQVNQVPSGERAVSFFSSQPAPVGALTPVTLNIDGQQRTVMATPQEAEQVRRGQIPAIRSFNVGGTNVPWYAYNQYDPYNDYYTYQNNGWRGVAGGAIAGFLGAEVLGSLFSPRPYWGGGWNSPYAYGPGWDSWGGWGGYGWDGGGFGGGWGGFGGGGYDQGYVQGEEMAHQQDYNNYDTGAGGSGFLGSGGGSGYDTSDYSGGAGFMGGGGDRS